MNLVHHHLICQAQVSVPELSKEDLINFLLDLNTEIKMEVLIDPVVKLSKYNAWTGLLGIVTSHISFHYWIDKKLLQIDIYSCKDFDKEKAISFINSFWNFKSKKVLFIDREEGADFKIEKIS